MRTESAAGFSWLEAVLRRRGFVAAAAVLLVLLRDSQADGQRTQQFVDGHADVEILEIPSGGNPQ